MGGMCFRMVSNAFVFPGQGGQIKREDIDFILNFPEARDTLDKSSELLGLDLFDLINRDVSSSDTRLSQLITYVISLSLFYTLQSKGIYPNVVAGHSLGEYSALTASGAISFEDGLKVVKRRGEIMAEASSKINGGMIAVIGLDKDVLIDIIKDTSDVEAVNFNSPKQTVLSGRTDSLEGVVPILREKGAKRIIPLEVAGPFHSSLFREYGKMFYLECIKDIDIKTPNVRFISSVKGKVVEDPQEIRECLEVHMYSPVKWVDVVRSIEEIGCTYSLEIGTGNVLNGLIKQTSDRFGLLENALDVLRRM